MKILQLKIIDDKGTEIRNIEFYEKGMTMIYGKIVKPKNDKKTSNSIGKTLLFKFISYILGRKEEKKDYPKDIIDWKLEANILYNWEIYAIDKILGFNEYKVNGEKYSYNKYIEFFKIERGINSKQIFLEKRNNIISSINKSPTKDDVKNFLILLKLNELLDIFVQTKTEQEKLKSYNEYNKFFKDDIKTLEKKQFVLLQKKTKLEQELQGIKNKIDHLNISEDSMKLIKIHSEKNSNLKEKKISIEKNQIRINRLNELIEECNKSDISSKDIISLYNQAQIVIPESTKRTLNEVQQFYNDMFKDKKEIYEKELKELEINNNNLQEEVKSLSKEVDNLSSKISDNDIFKEAMNLYEIKNTELTENQEEYGRVSGVIDDLSNKKKIEDSIKEKYIILEQKLEMYKELINVYRTYVFNLVNEIYEDDQEAYFDIEIPSDRRVNSMPIRVTLNLKGDKGEGISAVKNIVIDLLILYYNNLVEYLIQDSSCFEGIDKRQVATLIIKANEIATEKDKQYIVSVSEYHLQKDNEKLMKLVEEKTKLELSEGSLLLKKRIG